MKKLLGEIHGRSLWQVLGIYLAGSWIALQVVETLTESAALPDWVPSLALVLLVIGFPIVMATAFVQHGVGNRQTAEKVPAAAEGTLEATSEPSPAVEPAPAATIRSPGTAHGLFTWKRAILGGVGAAALLGVALGGWMVMRTLGIGSAGTLVAKGVLEDQAMVLLTEFESEDASLSRAATEAFRVDLEQSRVIDLAGPGFVAAALSRMELDPDVHLDGAIGRELAEREGMPALIAGEITAAGTSYVLTAQVISTDDGDVLAAERETAADDAELVPAINRLSKKLRERIGESLTDLAAGPSLERVTTSDLEALRLYSRAVRASDIGQNQEAADLLEETVARDSSFAMAWRKLGMVHVSGGGQLGQFTRGIEALTRAYQLRDRLTERERHLATAGYFSEVEQDPRRAAAAYEQMLENDPTDNWALNNLAIIVGPDFGEYDRAVELLERALEVDTLSQNHHWNLSVAQTSAGDLEGARGTVELWVRRLPEDPMAFGFLSVFEAAERNYEAADSLAVESARVRPGNLFDQALASRLLGMSAAARGRLSEALAHLGDSEATYSEVGAPGEALNAAVIAARVDLNVSGDRESAATRLDDAIVRYPLEDMGPLDVPWGGLSEAYAIAKGADAGRDMIARWETADPNAAADSDHGLTTGWVALAEGNTEEALVHFRDADQPGCQVCAMPALAAAHEAAGRPDSATVYLERYLERPYFFRLAEDGRYLGGTVERLGQLYDQQGDLENAAKYYAMFVELWAEADEELQPRVQAAQARLEEILRERG
jgi:tetratricopeptide (TPR) repeat protein